MVHSATETVVKYEVPGSNPPATYFFLWFLKAALLLLPDQGFFYENCIVLFCFAMYIRKYVYVQIIENSI